MTAVSNGCRWNSVVWFEIIPFLLFIHLENKSGIKFIPASGIKGATWFSMGNGVDARCESRFRIQYASS